MFHEVLVPLDGSPHSEQALPLAGVIADLAGSHLTLARVHSPIGRLARAANGSMRGAPLLAGDQLAIDTARRYLEGLARELAPELTGQSIATTVLIGGVSSELLRHARATATDLVVMTTHGRGAVGRAWLGSVADRLVRRSRIPILLLRPGEARPAPGAVPTWDHVLVPLDGSELAAQILTPALALARLTRARVTLLRVVDRALLAFGYPPVPHGAVLEPVSAAADEAVAREYLDRTAAALRAEDLDVDTSIIAHPRPAEAILDAAETAGAGLIALSTRGFGGVSRALLGSVADKVLRAATVPVLVQRPRAMMAGDAPSDVAELASAS